MVLLPFAWAPLFDKLTRVVVPATRSRTKTSVASLVSMSAATRLDESDQKAT
jgi:hypothetical protein